MDIHRCRFIPYPASSINALAFSHNTRSGQKTPHSLRLALGRANGDIEIWNPAKGIWSQETVFRGGKNRSVEGLVWTQDLDEVSESKHIPGRLRLFSIGYSNAITEWNLNTGMPLRHSSGSHAEVWSIAAQPRWRKEDGQANKSEQLLALGCADGSIVLQSTADEDLTYARILRRSSNKKARVLSLTFCDCNTIAAGCSDGTIWVYDIRGKGKVKTTMHLGAGPNKTSTYVWTLKYLSDRVLVSGDSTGELKFWDLKTFTITQRLLCHDADILTLAANADGTQFYSGGMDRKVCMVVKDKITRRWREIYHQKVHSGHVKAMTSIETKDLSIVVSGGIDAAPVLLPLKSSGRENVRTLPGLPQSAPLIGSKEDRLLVSWWDREVSFCELNKLLLQSISMSNPTTETDPLQRILVQGEENISSVSVSRDGKLLAIATNTSCKIFVLSRRKDGSSIRRVRRLESEILASQGARHVQFSPDGHWLLTIQPNNGINVYSIQIDAISKVGYRIEKHPTILKRLERDSLMIDPLRTYRSTVCKLTWSEDSTTIVSADLDGNMDIWSLNEENLKVNGVSKSGPPVTNGNTNGTTIDADTSEESDDEQSEYSSSTDNPPWKLLRFKLPKLPASPLLLSFRSGHESDDRLIVVTLRHEILEFHTRTGRLTDWSKRNPSSQLPSQFSQIKDRVMGCVWDCSNQRQRLWLYGSTFLFMFDMSKDLVIKPKNLIIQDGNRKRKRSRLSDGRDLNIKKNNGAGDFAAYQNDFGLTDLSHPTNKSSRTTTEDDDEEDKDEDDQASLRKGEHKSLTTSLLQLRRQTATATAEDQPDTDIDNEAETSDPTAEREKKPAARKNQSWWFTHKYRPILGLVTLARDVEAESDDEHGYAIGGDLEVALVERPLWDLDLDLPFLS